MWSTRRARRFRGGAATGLVLAALIGLAPYTSSLADEGGPLDRLRARSAEDCWQEHRYQWLESPDAEANDSAPAAPAGEPHAAPVAPPLEPRTASPTSPDEHSLFDAAAPTPDPEWAAPQAHDPDLQSLPDAAQQVLPEQAAVLPLPDFLGGAGPLWLAPRLRAAPHRAQSSRLTGRPGSQLVAAQSQSAQPAGVHERGMLRPITQISPFLDYDPEGGDACQYLCPTPTGICKGDANYLCPGEEPLPETGPAERYFADMNYFWAASNVYYNPLYFEDPVLERYGQVHLNDAVQPFYSVARFGGQLIGLPYQFALCPVHDRVYPLGYYRPGDPAPKLIYQPPLNARAGAVAAGVYTGLFFLVP